MGNNKSGSKYATLADAMKDKIDILSMGTDNLVREKEIEAELKRIDAETEQKIKEIKNSPVNVEQMKAQSKANYEALLLQNKQEKNQTINTAENRYNAAKQALKEAENELELAKEKAELNEKNKNLNLKHQYEQIINNADNTEKTIELKMAKAKNEGVQRKAQLQTELDNLIAKREAQDDKIKCIEELYTDLKEISLKVGDVKK